MKKELSISVIMTTYNGEDYVEEQLESIYNQTLEPDFVKIYDDCSTDKTVEIISSFIEKRKLNNWILTINKENKGWRKNFIDAIMLSTSDLIFLADQDDIWFSEKIELMTEQMKTNENIDLLACNLIPIYMDNINNQKIAKHITNKYSNNTLQKVEIDKFWLEPRRPGCSMCFRKTIIPYIKELWFKECAHDLVIWSYALSKQSAYIYNKELMYFRRHYGNNSPSNKKNYTTRISLINLYINIIKKFKNNYKSLNLDNDTISVIDKLDVFYLKRKNAMESKNIFKLLALFRYIKQYPTFKSWIADIISTYR